MKNITMIAAIGKNNELGKNNNLIWPIKEDLQFFKQQTMGKPVAMGMRTLESLPKLLPGRKHIVLTTKKTDLDPQILIVHSVEELLKFIEDYQEEVMIIGGARVYSEMIKYADKLVLTEIDAEDKEADAYFPKFNKEEYDCYELCAHEEDGLSYKHKIYQKKR